MPKRILMLGGSYFQIAPILYARKQGYYVITCDYLPDNPGHQYANEYHNISTTDKEAVLQLAHSLKINGILAYASDPAAPTAAYVAHKLGLAGNPYESVHLLTHKNRYRDFLHQHGFGAPNSASFTSLTDAKDYLKKREGEFMVKPVDSSGSKGISKITNKQQLAVAFDYALSFSRAKKVLIEQFIQRKGYQIAGDGFVVEGKLAFMCLAQEHFNQACNPFAPIGESFPLMLPGHIHQKIHQEIQRLLTLLHIKTGALNLDIFLDEQENVYLMEVGPRNGGNLIPELIQYASGVDLVKYTVEAALAHNCSQLVEEAKASVQCYSSFMLHSEKEGFFDNVNLAEEIKSNIVELAVFAKPGEKVHRFNGSHQTLGCAILKYSSGEEMLEKMEKMPQLIRVQLENEQVNIPTVPATV